MQLELWEAPDGIGSPHLLNAIVRDDGRVDVQQVEWQIERRYRFELAPGEFEAAARGLEALNAAWAAQVEGLRVVLADGAGRHMTTDERARVLVRNLANPIARQVKPHWSRGPAVLAFSPPFP